MAKGGMPLRPNDPYDLIGVSTTEHGQLDPVPIVGQEPGHIGTGGDRTDVHAGVAPPPHLHPLVEIVEPSFAKIFVPHAEGEHGRLTQLRLVHGVLNDRAVLGWIVDRHHDPVAVWPRLVLVGADDRHRAVRSFGQLCGG